MNKLTMLHTLKQIPLLLVFIYYMNNEDKFWMNNFCKLIITVRAEALSSSSSVSLEKERRQRAITLPPRQQSTPLEPRAVMAQKVQENKIQDKWSSYSTDASIVSSSSVATVSHDDTQRNVKQLLQSPQCNQLKVGSNEQGQVSYNVQGVDVRANQFSNGQQEQYVHTVSPIITPTSEQSMQRMQQQQDATVQGRNVMINGANIERSPGQVQYQQQQQQQQGRGEFVSSAPYDDARARQINYDSMKQSPQLSEARREAEWKTYDLSNCMLLESPLGGLDLPVIGASTQQAKRCNDVLRPYLRYHSSTWSMGCCRVDTGLQDYQVSKTQCCLLGGSRCEFNGIPCCNGQSCCNGRCRMTAGFFTDANLALTISSIGQPKVGVNVVPLIYAEYERCSDAGRPHHYSYKQMHEKYFGCCIMPPASSEMASKLCCLLARSACDGGIPCCNSALCTNGRCPVESGDLTWPALTNVTCVSSQFPAQGISMNYNSNGNFQPGYAMPGPQSQQQQQRQQQQQQQTQPPSKVYHQISRDPLIQLADPVHKYFYLSHFNGGQMQIACRRDDMGNFISDPEQGKQCCLMAGSPCSPLISCCRGVACCGGRCVKQAGSINDRTGYSIAFNECHEKD